MEIVPKSLLNKYFFFASLFFTSQFVLQAQTKQLSLYDAVLNGDLRTESLNQVGWVKGTNTIFYEDPVEENKLIYYNFDTDQIDTTFNFSVFASDIAGILGDTITSLPRINFENAETFSFTYKSVRYDYHVQTKKLTKVIKFPSAQAMEYHKKSNQLAYVKNDNVYIKTGDSAALQLTMDGGEGIVYGQAVHRNEFGIMEGLFWSSNGKKLAFYRMDETMVTEYPIYKLIDTPATVRKIRYPVAGAKSHHVTIGIYDVDTKKVTYLQTGGNPEDYLTNVAWTPDEKYVLIARLNRGQNKMNLEEYDASSGNKIKSHFTETSNQYVEPENPVVFQNGDSKCYYWQSERDGFNHIYLYKNGILKKQMTKGSWMVTSIVGQDEDDPSKNDEEVYFTSTMASPLETHYYRMNSEGGKITQITKEAGTHFCIPNEDFTLWIDIFSSTTVPNKTQVLDRNGLVNKVILEAKDPLADYQLGTTKIFKVDHEGTDLYVRMITPPNFDSTRRYPVITYVYGGPHAQMITNKYLGGSNYWMQMMAQKGYIVFTMDNRGSKNRGFAFESSIHRGVGDKELSDQLFGVKYLKSLNYVDTTRMGVHGWSFGGFMTTSLMTRYPEAYQVGVAGGPVIDWNYYEIMYTERYMDSPAENKDGYSKNSLFQYIYNLSGRLLMIHGTDDDVVLWQHSLLYVKSAVDANNINLDYFVYPGHPHNVRGRDRLHLMGKITQYFEDHL